MVSGLAYYLSMKYTPQLTQQMKLVYEDEFKEHYKKMVLFQVHILHQKLITQEHNAKIRNR